MQLHVVHHKQETTMDTTLVTMLGGMTLVVQQLV